MINKYNYSQIGEIKSAKQKIKIICPHHGSFLQTVDSHLNGKQGCPKCSRERTIQSRSKSIIQLTVDNQIIKQYKSIADAVRNVFESDSESIRIGIGRACKTGNKYNNWLWKYASDINSNKL